MSNSHHTRLDGLDLARSLAMFGMLIMNFIVVTGAQGNGHFLLVSMTNLVEGRAAATFVTLAGIGISLMTKKARVTSDLRLRKNSKISLVKRSLFLYIVGMLLYTLGWDGDILHYYGVYMAFTVLILFSSPKIIITISIVLAGIAQFYQIFFDYMNGWHPNHPFLAYLDFWTISGFLRNLFLNGYHPVFPWICFLMIGLLIGRLNLRDNKTRNTILLFSTILFVISELLSRLLISFTTDTLLDATSATFLFATGPLPPNLFYLLSNTATALVIIVLALYVAEIYAGNWFIRSLIFTGQLTLTHYVSHVVIGIGLLLTFDKVVLFNGFESQPLSFTVLYACGFFAASILFSTYWRLQFSRGPIETVMRKWT
ncbi:MULTISPECIES: DUF418 domain-containing protein [Shouchella]|uniref:Heparan-alpha-glucosaminide N-acetyltransferase domain-containing protein n=2 Tax=Shouchella TaxID=2893057 RepID=A0ABY7W7I8_9BACI|nr:MULTISPECIES: heparan-alpha-glucosaminide N-acetyltransferase domain-containing protein [Shouchella]MED4130513.1 heparan-alpha-glucosaminide N-acetyltransferase domain-containing protein [Shouchella miscanthi]WDF03448.1 heparan-alpha-glucosaminide N-acetyltransferase domain-containing protein [Shouchella hunanensis]GAF24109.1 membrane protein [Bacillus sp. JCM 19047]